MKTNKETNDFVKIENITYKVIDVFPIYQKIVYDMNLKYNWNIDIYNDDEMSDFLNDLNKLNYLKQNELCVLLFYNNVLQSSCFNPYGDVIIKSYIPIDN